MTPSSDPGRVKIGDTVHYVSYGTPLGEYSSECRAAIVTELDKHPEGNDNPGQEFVGLAILNPTGMFFNTCRLRDSVDFSGGSWHGRAECPGPDGLNNYTDTDNDTEEDNDQ